MQHQTMKISKIILAGLVSLASCTPAKENGEAVPESKQGISVDQITLVETSQNSIKSKIPMVVDLSGENEVVVKEINDRIKDWFGIESFVSYRSK